MKLRHICEVCGKEEILTPEEAFEKGWDYPPMMGYYGIVSPRTCPDCSIEKTVWWKLSSTGVSDVSELTSEELKVIERIQSEPESILVED